MSKRVGRQAPTINDEKVKVLIASLKNGAYVETACSYAGIGTSSVYRWLERGKAEDERVQKGEEPNPEETPYWEIWDTIEKARSEATLRNITLIQTAAQNGSWQAAAWFLERTAPKLYARRSYSEVTGADGGALEISMSIDDLNSKIASLMGEHNELGEPASASS